MNGSYHLPSPYAGRWCVVSAWLPELEHLTATLPALLRQEVLCATVGVGLVEAAAGAARLLAEHRPKALLLVGTAGAYPGCGRRLALGTAAVVDEMVLLPSLLPDEAAYLPELIPIRERSSATLLKALRRATHLPSADVACPLAITVSSETATTAARLSGCALENLEAFAVARAAAHAEIPFAAVLGVANHVGPSGRREWQENARRAAAAACESVLAFITSSRKAAASPRTCRAERTTKKK
jgi:futalosine hydrolase